MTERPDMWIRLAALVTLVESSPGKVLGRTAAVKLPYLLQELYGVDLGYDFRLYTYGPYDADVLYDLATAQSLDAVSVKTIPYQSGYGYEIRTGPSADTVKSRAGDWLRRNHGRLELVAKKFGGWNASDLELASTVIYVDREFKSQSGEVAEDALARRVREVKPHFPEPYVLAKVRELHAEGYLLSLTRALASPSGAAG